MKNHSELSCSVFQIVFSGFEFLRNLFVNRYSVSKEEFSISYLPKKTNSCSFPVLIKMSDRNVFHG